MAADPTLDQKLIAAAYANDVDAARELIEAGADVNAKDESVQSAYLIATSEVGDDTASSSSRSQAAPTSARSTATTGPG